MYSRKDSFDCFTRHAKRNNLLTETQIGSVVGINKVDHYSRLFVFVCLDPVNVKQSIYLQFTFWDSSVSISLINRKPLIPEQPTPATYEDSTIKVINPNPNHPKLNKLINWLEWAHQQTTNT